MPRRPKPPPEPEPPRRRRRGQGSVRQRKDKLWEARLPGPMGRASKYFQTEPEAKAWLRGELSPPQGPPGATELFGAYLSRWYDRSTPRWSRARAASATTAIARAEPLWRIPLGTLRPDHVGDWTAAMLREGLVPNSVRTYLAIIKQALGEIVPDVLPANPAGRRPSIPTVQREDPKHWSQLESERFLKLATGTPGYPLFLFLLGTGARLGEALGLRWQDVDLAAGIARINGAWDSTGRQRGPTKSRRSRSVILTPRVVRTLAALPARDGYVFPGFIPGRPCSHSGAEKWFRQIVARAAEAGTPLAPIKPHGLRHTFASVALANGVPLATVAQALGHANPGTTTKTYSHALQNRDGDAERALADALGWT